MDERILNDDGRQRVPCDAVGAAFSESPFDSRPDGAVIGHITGYKVAKQI